MRKPLRLLIVEDNEDDALLIVGELERSGFEPIVERVETEAALNGALQRMEWDVIISDNRLPTFSGAAALRLVRATGLDIPFIIVSGTIGEEQAVQAMKQGANDYLLKDRLGRLGAAVAHELEHRRLREESRRTQQQLLLQTTALQTAANAVVITERSGQILWVNPAFTALSGYTAAEAIGHTPRLLKSGYHDDAFYESFWKTICAGQTWRGEFTNRRKDGSLYLDDHTVTPVRNAEGKITHFIGIMHDVTARKHAEAELLRTVAQLEHLLKHSPVVIYSLKVVGERVQPTMVSENVVRLLGFAAEEACTYEWWANRLHPEDRERAYASIPATLAQEALSIEYRLRHRDGHYVWLEDNRRTVRDASGRPVEIAGVWTDLTQRKRLESDLKVREQQLGAFFTGAAAGLALLDRELRFVHLNETLAQINGAPVGDHLGRPLADMLPSLAMELVPLLERVLCTGETARNIELSSATPDASGPQRHWIASLFPIPGPDGATAGVGAIVVEVTALKQSEAALHESEARIHLAVAAANIGFWDWNLLTNEVYFSREWKSQLGYDEHDISNRFEEWQSRLHPEDLEPTLADVRAYLEGKAAEYKAEFRLRHRDGSYRWIFTEAQLARDAGGRPARLVGCHLDITERKRAEAELLESKRFAFSTIDALSAHLCVVDESGTILVTNQAWRRFAEANEASFHRVSTGANYLEVCDATRGREAPTAQEFAAGVRAVIAGELPEFTLEYPCHSATEERWFVARVTRFAGTGRRRAVVAHENISERKRAEAALVESERMYRLMVDNMGECVLLLDLRLRHVFASPSVSKVYGYTPEEFIAQPVERILCPDSFREALRIFEEEMALETSGAADPRRTRVMEVRVYRKDGSSIWIGNTLSFIRDAGGRAVQILCVSKDITERRRAMQELSESRHLLERAQIVAHIGSWVSDPGPPTRLVWSAETFRIFGVDPASFDGRTESFVALVHPEDRDEVARAALAALTTGKPYDLEHRIVRPDGEVRWVHEQADVEREPTGRPVRMVGVVQDITQRKQLEEQLRQAQKMEAIGQLAGGIAHDFNNILGSILGNAELLKLLTPGGPDAAECIDDILAGSRRASDLVGQILAFSRRQESRRLPMQVHPVVREVLKLLRATVPVNVEFRANLAGAPAILADPSELHQVIMNLCTNSWHAMQGRGGVITVEVGETELDRAFVTRHPDLRPGRYVRLTVADNGCGMDEATLGRIFEPFFTTKPVGQGTGLGLSVVHGIMKNHDGGIVVQSKPGQGTSFQLYFPVFASEAAATAPAPQRVPHGSGEHVLFVDDEEPLARMGTRTLQRLGYRVTQHTRPAEALAAFRARSDDFDLVVVDYNMPGMNGTEFGAKVLEIRPAQRIVLTTGFSATLTAETVRELGFVGLMPKPYDLNCLGETVYRALHPSGASQ